MEMYDPHRSGVRRRVTGGVDNPAMRYDGTTGHVEPVNGTAYEPGMNSHVHRTVSCNITRIAYITALTPRSSRPTYLFNGI